MSNKGIVYDRVNEIQQPRLNTKTKQENSTKDSSELQLQEQCIWGRYARGAVYALQSRGHNLSKVRDNAMTVHLSVHHLTIPS